MKILKILLISVAVLLIGVSIFGNWYLNSGSLEPDNSVWQAYIGRDTTVGILPDQYANYFTYTLARTNKDIGLKIQGEFPDTRYMSFNVYNLRDNSTQGSLVDYQIQTDSGKPNPFIANKDSVTTGNKYTAYIIPERYEHHRLPNQLVFNDDCRLLLVVIRLYDFNKDDFGGVEYPTVQAFTLDEDEKDIEFQAVHLPKALNLRSIVRRFSLPRMVERLGWLFETEKTLPVDASNSNQKYNSIPFHGVNDDGFIENNDNRYLMAAITKKEDEVYVFHFKAPTYTTGPENINQTQVRYWSFNLGNAATYNFNALKDEEAIMDENGIVRLVLANKDSEIEQRTEELGYNFMEWNMPWKKGFILFRHMLANPNFEAQIEAVPPFQQGMNNMEAIEAHQFMGDYAPRGLRMSKEDFLNEYK